MDGDEFALSTSNTLYFVLDTGTALSKVSRTVSGYGSDLFIGFQKSTAINAGYIMSAQIACAGKQVRCGRGHR
jgi:hypothetical protein